MTDSKAPRLSTAGRFPRPARALAGTLATMGTLHFLAPKPFDAIVPRGSPAARAPGRTSAAWPS
ncbi:hypothetical protein [Actinomadura sp. J1-007]|uniref:hypothetical protein n=1 Tax=Actinomadura sp. J1-007 TaxID=2661913 RepID=UPI001F502F02|nr:hypothetical protein [Actinomadura sp. J1-007]